MINDQIDLDEQSVYLTRDKECSVVSIEGLELNGSSDQCDHMYQFGGHRLYAIELNPQSGYWTSCPNCGRILGQKNLGEIPRELRE